MTKKIVSIFLSILLTPLFSFAMITRDATSTSGALSGSSVSWNHIIGSGDNRFLLVGVACGGFPLATATFNGIPMTILDSALGNTTRNTFAYLANPPVGSSSIALTFTGGCGFVRGAGISLFGVQDIDSNGSSTSNSDSISKTLSGLNTNGWGVAFIRGENSGTATGDANTKIAVDINNGDAGLYDSSGTINSSPFTMGGSWGVPQVAGSALLMAVLFPFSSANAEALSTTTDAIVGNFFGYGTLLLEFGFILSLCIIIYKLFK